MADVHSREVRSYNMSRVKSANTKPELLVRSFLHRQGLRFRLNDKKLPGKPDIVLPKYKKVIFINGCFWHGHQGCRYFVIPKTRTEWWENKIARNASNDTKAIELLQKAGWKVLTVWECDLKKDKRDQTLTDIFKQIVT